MELTGGCQCGAIRYQAHVDDNEAYYCHCRMCQRAFGNIFAALVLLKKSDLNWVKGKPTYFSSSKLALRGFCQDCGTPLTFEYRDGVKMDISVGSLDDPNLMKPACHNGVESRVNSFVWHDDLPQSRTEDNQNYVAKWKNAYGDSAMPGPVTGFTAPPRGKN